MENLLDVYDREVRANPVYPDIIRVTKTRHLVRLIGTGSFSFISYWNIPEEQTRNTIQQEVQSLKDNGGQIMWRVFEHDKPDDLEAELEMAGFKAIDQVTLMLLPLQNFEFEVPDLDIRKLNSERELQDFLSVTETAFGEPSPQNMEYHSRLLNYPNFNYYVGYSDNLPVAAARFEVPDDSRFGFFFGGCVIPEFRKKGFYTALINARLKQAKKLNLEFISTDARETSKAILEKTGFKPLVKGRTWHLKIDT